MSEYIFIMPETVSQLLFLHEPRWTRQHSTICTVGDEKTIAKLQDRQYRLFTPLTQPITGLLSSGELYQGIPLCHISACEGIWVKQAIRTDLLYRNYVCALCLCVGQSVWGTSSRMRGKAINHFLSTGGTSVGYLLGSAYHWQVKTECYTVWGSSDAGVPSSRYGLYAWVRLCQCTPYQIYFLK